MFAAEKIEGPLNLATATARLEAGFQVLAMPVERVDERVDSRAFRGAGRDDRMLGGAFNSTHEGAGTGRVDVDRPYVGDPTNGLLEFIPPPNRVAYRPWNGDWHLFILGIEYAAPCWLATEAVRKRSSEIAEINPNWTAPLLVSRHALPSGFNASRASALTECLRTAAY